MADLQPIYVRVCDSRAVFGISRSTIYEMAARAEITIYKSGGKALLKVAEVMAFIEANPGQQRSIGGPVGGPAGA